MLQIKQIIETRIKDILEIRNFIHLKRKALNSSTMVELNQTRHEMMLRHKRMQEFRNGRQTQLLANLTVLNFQSESFLSQIYSTILDIMIVYDQTFTNYQLNQQEMKNSKEKLRQILQQFFKKHSFKQKIRTINFNFKKSFFLLNPALLMGWMCEWSKKIYYQTLKEENLQSSKLPNEIQIKRRDNSERQYQTLRNFDDQMILLTRINIFAYFLDDVQSYYKMVKISDLDHQYVKNIRKKYSKISLIHKDIIQKFVQVLMDTPQNRFISTSMREYRRLYDCKFQKVILPLQTKKIWNEPKKKLSIAEQDRKGRKNITQPIHKIDIKIQANILSNSFEFKEKKNEIVEKIKLMKIKKIVKLPEINKTIQKSKSRSLVRKFLTDTSETTDNLIHNFSVQNSQKNLEEKKLLFKRKELTQRTQESNEDVFSQVRPFYCPQFKPKQDLYTIRQKSRALLKNYNSIKRYH